jgi:hypothetical protein
MYLSRTSVYDLDSFRRMCRFPFSITYVSSIMMLVSIPTRASKNSTRKSNRIRHNSAAQVGTKLFAVFLQCGLISGPPMEESLPTRRAGTGSCCFHFSSPQEPQTAQVCQGSCLRRLRSGSVLVLFRNDAQANPCVRLSVCPRTHPRSKANQRSYWTERLRKIKPL